MPSIFLKGFLPGASIALKFSWALRSWSSALCFVELSHCCKWLKLELLSPAPAGLSWSSGSVATVVFGRSEYSPDFALGFRTRARAVEIFSGDSFELSSSCRLLFVAVGSARPSLSSDSSGFESGAAGFPKLIFSWIWEIINLRMRNYFTFGFWFWLFAKSGIVSVSFKLTPATGGAVDSYASNASWVW